MKTIAVPALVIASALAIAACGSSSSSSSGTSSSSSGAGGTVASGGGYGGGASSSTKAATTTGSGAKLALGAKEAGGLSFSRSALSAKAGKVTITLSNASSNSLPHGIAIQGNGVAQTGSTVSPGGTSSVTATLKPGTYTFYCPVPGHRQAGMQGTLTVR